MTPRYSVTFALLPRAHRDGTHSVAVTVTWCRQRWRRTLPVSCPPDCWETTLQLARARGSFHASAEVNEAVLSTRERIDKLFMLRAATLAIPSPHDLDTLFTAAADPAARRTIADTINEFVAVQSRERSWQPGTRVKFAMLGRELAACGLTYLDEIDDAAQGAFHDLHAAHGLRNSTLAKKVAILNWFLRWCNAQGFCHAPLAQPHLRQVPRNVTYLEWDELMHFYRFDYDGHPSLAHVRDVFCFCAFTGLRYSDAEALRWSDVSGDMLRVVTVKTAEALEIPLNKYASAILLRYAGTRGRIFAAPTNQATNRLLKDAAMLAGFDRPVRQVFYRGAERCEEEKLTWEAFTTHWARRTFVVHSIRLGIPAEVVTRFTGHRNLSAMKPYIAIVDELKREAMRRFDET